MITGIYKIKNKITNQVYIGQSVDIKARWAAHKSPGTWNDKTKPSYYYRLYTAFREYGLENFEFSVIEECEKVNLNEREKYWIKYYDSFNNGYNMTPGGQTYGNNKVSAVYQYSLEGKFLQKYDSVREAAEKYNIPVHNIYSALSRNNIAGKYQWSYVKVDRMDSNFSNRIPVISFTLKGQRVNTYLGMNEAAQLSGDSWNTIKKSCETHQHSGKYQWRYWAEDPDIKQIPAYQWNPKQAIDQYDLNGIYITTYESIANAAKNLGLDASNLTTRCKNRQKSYGNYLWVYHNEPAPEVYIDKRIGHLTSSSKRIVLQYSKENQYIKEYESAHEAARQINKPKCANHITECCQGKRKTCEGYIWKYKED